MKQAEQSSMPAIIVGTVIVGFYVWGSYVLLYTLGSPWSDAHPDPKAFSILDMFIVQAIGLTTGGVGYWLGKTHSDANKDIMLHNSTPSPAPTEQTVRSITTSTSTPEPEAKP